MSWLQFSSETESFPLVKVKAQLRRADPGAKLPSGIAVSISVTLRS